jgi:hypothetical protein
MLGFSALKRRTYFAFGVALACAPVLLALSAPAGAQVPIAPGEMPVVELANPIAGDVLPVGDYVVTGTAFDPAATEGAGVSRVDLFLGNRELGGVFLGSAVPGQDVIKNVTPGTRLAETGFQTTVTLPTNVMGGTDLVAYAYSSVTGRVISVRLPVYVGVAPTPTPVSETAVAPQPVVGPLMPLPAAQGEAMFSLANPSNGDVVLKGAYNVSGATGPSIDRVELFLGDREAGGLHLGTVAPVNGAFNMQVTIPQTMSGGVDLCAYAYSSMTGKESEIAVPIYLGAPPMPTPRPAISVEAPASIE